MGIRPERLQRSRFNSDQGLRLLLILSFFAAIAFAFAGSLPVSHRAAIVAAAIGLVLVVKRLRPSLFEQPRARVEVDADGVRRILGQKLLEQVRWSELVKVAVLTTDEGPFAEDFFWMLYAADGTGCAVPQNLAVEVDLLTRLQRLPGFDHAAVIAASGSTDVAQFVCWQGAAGEGRAASVEGTASPQALS